MDPWIFWFTGIAVLLVVALPVTFIWTGRRKTRRLIAAHEAQDEQWLAKTEALKLTNELHLAEEPNRSDAFGYRRNLPKAIADLFREADRARDDHELAKVHRRSAAKLDEAMAVEGESERLEAFMKLQVYSHPLYNRLSESDQARFRTEATLLADHHVARLLAKAKHGDTEAFIQLIGFTELVGNGAMRYELSSYGLLTGRRYKEPDEWPDLVARLVKNPSVSQFRTDMNLVGGEFRLLAASSLRERNLRTAKYVLAYANENPSVRVELGGLADELAKLIIEIHTMERLFTE